MWLHQASLTVVSPHCVLVLDPARDFNFLFIFSLKKKKKKADIVATGLQSAVPLSPAMPDLNIWEANLSTGPERDKAGKQPLCISEEGLSLSLWFRSKV